MDNGSSKFKLPHRDALSPDKINRVVQAIEQVLETHCSAGDICAETKQVLEKGSSAEEVQGEGLESSRQLRNGVGGFLNEYDPITVFLDDRNLAKTRTASSSAVHARPDVA